MEIFRGELWWHGVSKIHNKWKPTYLLIILSQNSNNDCTIKTFVWVSDFLDFGIQIRYYRFHYLENKKNPDQLSFDGVLITEVRLAAHSNFSNFFILVNWYYPELKQEYHWGSIRGKVPNASFIVWPRYRRLLVQWKTRYSFVQFGQIKIKFHWYAQYSI